MDLLIARNPDPESRLEYLLRLPIGRGLVFRTSGTWPRTNALFCYAMPESEWPDEPDIAERAELASCVRRGGAIDIVLVRGRENRSQIVFTKARGRDAVFWQSARTRKQSRPAVQTSTARAAGIAELPIVVDTRERYPFKFSGQQVACVRRALPAGDYGVEVGGRLVATVERKSLPDLLSTMRGGRMRSMMAGLTSIPRAAVIVEERYSAIFKPNAFIRPAVIGDDLAGLQIAFPSIPIVFADNRKFAEEWVYRYLAAAYAWALDELPALERIGLTVTELAGEAATTEPKDREVRAWAATVGIEVPAQGRLPKRFRELWHEAVSTANPLR